MTHSPIILDMLEDQANKLQMPFNELLKVYASEYQNRQLRKVLLVKPNKGN